MAITESLECLMCPLSQRYPDPDISIFMQEFFSRYSRGRVLIVTAILPDKSDWISEFCEANFIPFEKKPADQDDVALKIRPADEIQGEKLWRALVDDSVWNSYNGAFLWFRTPSDQPEASEPVIVTGFAEGKGFAFNGSPESISEVRKLIEQVAASFTPPVILKTDRPRY